MSTKLSQMEKELQLAQRKMNKISEQIQEEKNRIAREERAAKGFYTPLKKGKIKEDMWLIYVSYTDADNGKWIGRSVTELTPEWPKGMEVVLIRDEFGDEFWVPAELDNYEEFDRYMYGTKHIVEITDV